MAHESSAEQCVDRPHARAGVFRCTSGPGPRRAGRIGAGKLRYHFEAYTERDAATPPADRFSDQCLGQFANPARPKVWRFSTTSKTEANKVIRQLKRKGFSEA